MSEKFKEKKSREKLLVANISWILLTKILSRHADVCPSESIYFAKESLNEFSWNFTDFMLLDFLSDQKNAFKFRIVRRLTPEHFGKDPREVHDKVEHMRHGRTAPQMKVLVLINIYSRCFLKLFVQESKHLNHIRTVPGRKSSAPWFIGPSDENLSLHKLNHRLADFWNRLASAFGRQLVSLDKSRCRLA